MSEVVDKHEIERSFQTLLKYLSENDFKLREFYLKEKLLPIDLFFTSKKDVFHLIEKNIKTKDELNNFMTQFEYDLFQTI